MREANTSAGHQEPPTGPAGAAGISQNPRFTPTERTQFSASAVVAIVILVLSTLVLSGGAALVVANGPTDAEQEASSAPPLPPVRYRDTTAALLAVQAASSTAEVKEVMDTQVLAPYGLVLGVPIGDFKVRSTGGSGVSEDDLPRIKAFAVVVARSITVYRPAAFGELDIEKIVITRRIQKSNTELRADEIAGLATRDALYFALDKLFNAPENVFHHELAHAFCNAHFRACMAYEDQWEAINPPGFTRAGKLPATAPVPDGFITTYAASSYPEDLAEMWSEVMAPAQYEGNWRRLQRDARLMAKFDITLEVMALADPLIDAKFVAAANGYPNPNHVSSVKLHWNERTRRLE